MRALTVGQTSSPYFVRGRGRRPEFEAPDVRERKRAARREWLENGKRGHAPYCNRVKKPLEVVQDGNVELMCPGCNGIFC